MTKLTVVCLKTGNKFDDRYVVRLRNMVQRNLSLPHQFVCFTDNPVKGVRNLPPPTTFPGWWGKLGFFKPDLPIEGPYLYLDLDMCVVGPLDELVKTDSEFLIIKQWKKNIKPMTKFGKTVSAYNSSCMYFSGCGVLPKVWWDFSMNDHRGQRGLRGDQDWIAYCYPDLPTFEPSWFKTYEDVDIDKGPQPPVRLTIHNKWDNHLVEDVWWVREHWR